ncbi:MAG: hypothetical protein WCZ89_07100 [Phycisphaerae bacterium]
MDHIEKTIEELRQKVLEKEKELNDAKTTVNNLCSMVGKPPLYTIEEQASVVPVGNLHGDEYYGRPFAGVVTTILEGRKIQGLGPATVREIYDIMIAGGYQFETQDTNNAMRGMRISLTKNQKFHKLPNGKWGMTEWYPKIKVNKEPQTKDEPDESPDSTVNSKENKE